MNFVQAGYRILMVLAIAKGHYTVSNGKIIVDFLAKYYQEDIDIDKENELLETIGAEDAHNHLASWASVFTDEKIKLDFLAFCYKMMTPHPNEMKLITAIALDWDIDIAPMFAETSLF